MKIAILIQVWTFSALAGGSTALATPVFSIDRDALQSKMVSLPQKLASKKAKAGSVGLFRAELETGIGGQAGFEFITDYFKRLQLAATNRSDLYSLSLSQDETQGDRDGNIEIQWPLIQALKKNMARNDFESCVAFLLAHEISHYLQEEMDLRSVTQDSNRPSDFDINERPFQRFERDSGETKSQWAQWKSDFIRREGRWHSMTDAIALIVLRQAQFDTRGGLRTLEFLSKHASAFAGEESRDLLQADLRFRIQNMKAILSSEQK